MEELSLEAGFSGVPIEPRARNRMNNTEEGQIPMGVGNHSAQQRFIERHRKFLLEYPKLYALYTKIFVRAVEPPDENERQSLLHLSDTDPAVIAFEDRGTSGLLVFYLGRIAADDFGEILELCGNGAGFGAFIHLRGMYERIVTAMYIAKTPSEGRLFAESSAIQKMNYLPRLTTIIPDLAHKYDDAFMQQVKADADAARAKRKQSFCQKCKQPITNEAWTRVSLDVMAGAVDSDLERLYGPIYLEGTYQAHANSLGIERRLVFTGSGYQYKDISEDEAAQALHFAHRLMLKLVEFQNKHFRLHHDEEVAERFRAFNLIWTKSPEASQSTSGEA